MRPIATRQQLTEIRWRLYGALPSLDLVLDTVEEALDALRAAYKELGHEEMFYAWHRDYAAVFALAQCAAEEPVSAEAVNDAADRATKVALHLGKLLGMTPERVAILINTEGLRPLPPDIPAALGLPSVPSEGQRRVDP